MVKQTIFIAKPPKVAGKPIADLLLNYKLRSEINGAFFKKNKIKKKGDKVMNDVVLGKRFWEELEGFTNLSE